MLVHHPDIHEGVRAEHVELEVIACNVHSTGLARELEHRIGQRALAKKLGHVKCLGHLVGSLWQGHQARARALVQGFEQRQHLVAQHAGHQPLAALLIHLVQHKQRHGHGQAVARIAGFVQVGCSTVHPAQAQSFGEGAGGDAGGLVTHQLLARQQQELRLLFELLPIPAFQGVAAAHLGWQLLVVKGVNQLLLHQHVLPARLVLQIFHLANQLLVSGQKRQRRFPLAGHQCLADKNFACPGQVDPAVINPPPAVNHQAVQRGALQRHHLASFFLPVRVQQLLLE